MHEEDFETFSDLLWDIVEASPHLLWARSQGNYDVSPCYIKQGGPSALNVSKQNIEVDLRLSLDANSQALVSPVEDQDQLLSEQNDDGLYSQSVAEIACGCLPATEVVNKPTVRHVLAEMAEKLPSHWREVQDQLPDSYKWDVEFMANHLGGAAENGCWSCTPLLDGKLKQIPLTIAHDPLVIPVEHRWLTC